MTLLPFGLPLIGAFLVLMALPERLLWPALKALGVGAWLAFLIWLEHLITAF